MLARRTFTLADQQDFAALSGDWNPLHVDPIAARRTLMGAPVVHGIHLVAWTLDRWLATQPAVRITRLRAAFKKPVYLEQPVTIAVAERTFTLTSDGATSMEMTIETAPGVDDAPVDAGSWPVPLAPAVLDRDAAAHARGELPLAIDAGRARAMFPAAVERLGLAQLADLLATTRVVGMHCPGLHSLFSALTLHARDEARSALAYEVAKAQPKYSMYSLAVTGARFTGTLETFYRPTPRVLAMTDVARVVTPGEFAAQRAFVVGGSRGLGEAFAKAIAAGGGEVTVTYHRGRDDAERVATEIREAGGRARAMRFDVLAPALDWEGLAPTHLYYLATPTLFSIRKGAPFKRDELDSLVGYFTVGLHETIARVVALGGAHLHVWTPSTTMLDTPAGGVAYCIAKAAMEELCKHLPSLFPVTIHTPRLGRIDTDQTLGLIQLPSSPALDVAIAQLRRYNSAP